jgi:ribosome-binding protein aMBF1 (putative translation factor)
MKKHTQVYLKHFKYDTSDFIPCEVCGNKAVDIHHIINRGMGATDQINIIENLMAVCRECHIKYGDKKEHLEYLQRIHLNILYN